jgi:multiple sugar transport system substrate-binding protein
MGSKLSKKLLLCLLFVGLTGLDMASAQSTTLSLWSRADGEALTDALVEEWNSTHDAQIEVTYIPPEEFVTKFATSVAGGISPDIVSLDLIYTPAFMAAGQLTDLTELAQSMPFYDHLSPSHMRLGTWSDGRLYSLPFKAEGSVLLYNKDLFAQAGLDPESPPTTWDEIYRAAEAITALGDDIYGYYFSGACAGCNAFTFMPLIWASGGDILSEDYSRPTLTDPAVAEALDFYRRMWEAGLVPEGVRVDNGADFINAFTSGKIGMAGSGAFSIALLTNQYPDLDFGLTFLPGKDGGRSSFAGGDNIAIPTGSGHVEEAFEFLEWVLSDEVQLEIYARNGHLPMRTDLADNPYFEAEPRLVTSATAMGIGRTPYSTVYNNLFNDPNGPWLQMLQSAIFDGNVERAVQDAQTRFERVMR